jgi:hypothetical protein
MKKKLLFISLPILCICTLWVGLTVACNQPESDIVLDSQAIAFEIDWKEKSVFPTELTSDGRLELTVVCLRDRDVDLMVSNPSGQVEILTTVVGTENFTIEIEESGKYLITLENPDTTGHVQRRTGALFLKYIAGHNQKLLVSTTTKTVTKTRTQARTLTQTITETKNPPITFSSSGNKITTTFIVNSSPWIIQYSTNYTGRFTIALEPYVNRLIVNNEEVITGEVYQVAMEGYTGLGLHFGVRADARGQRGDWTISVIEVTD